MFPCIAKRWIRYVEWAGVAALVTFLSFTFFYPVRVPAEMQGKWLVVEGKDLHGATLEILTDGSVIAIIPTDGKEVTMHGRLTLDGNRFRVTPDNHVSVTDTLARLLRISTQGNQAGGELETEPEEILDLTDQRFVVQDSHGEVLIMERRATAGDGR